MAIPVIMPKQGQSVESCILTEWYKEEGDSVSQGDLLFAYETDKAAFEEEAQADGILLSRFYESGDEVPVLINVAVLGSEGEAVDEFRPGGAESASVPEAPAATEVASATTATATVAAASAPPVDSEPSGKTIDPCSDTPGDGKLAISPRARKLACEKRVMLEGIVGSGPGGRVIERDILEEIKKGKRLTPLAQKKVEGQEGLHVPAEGKSPFGKITSKDLVEAPASSANEGEYVEIPLSNVRKIIASAMYNSLQNSAQLTHHLSANASGMLQLRKEVKNRSKDGSSQNITLNDMVVYAVIRALKIYPEANAQFVDGKIRQFKKVNMGLAVDTERGLLVPALLNADDFSLPGLSSQLKGVVDAARGGKISPDLLAPQMASFTISNLGNYGVEMFTPVINLPQVAILGVNTIIQRPMTMPDGSFAFQPFIGLSLTYDHRAIDGGPATKFLGEIKNQIEQLSIDLL
ncbi:MAG: dihydrolipoamide acetyltransferase family protein [Bacteroides sp.]|nr:dihydrolipoamide acetyltransferase family protein [Bacteroides sp.]